MRLLPALALALAVLALSTTSGNSHQPALWQPDSRGTMLPATGPVATLVASAPGSQFSSGDMVDLSVSVANWQGAVACGTSTLVWTLASQSGGQYSILNAQSFGTDAVANGTWNYGWTATSGSWTFVAVMNSTGGCAGAQSSPVSLTVASGSGGGLLSNLPSWLQQLLTTTYDAVRSFLDTAIAAPIASVLVTVGQSIAILEAPWSSTLASFGIWGPVVLVFGFGGTAIACYAILEGAGAVRAAMGD